MVEPCQLLRLELVHPEKLLYSEYRIRQTALCPSSAMVAPRHECDPGRGQGRRLIVVPTPRDYGHGGNPCHVTFIYAKEATKEIRRHRRVRPRPQRSGDIAAHETAALRIE